MPKDRHIKCHLSVRVSEEAMGKFQAFMFKREFETVTETLEYIFMHLDEIKVEFEISDEDARWLEEYQQKNDLPDLATAFEQAIRKLYRMEEELRKNNPQEYAKYLKRFNLES